MMERYKSIYSESEYYSVDRETEKRAGLSDPKNYKWKNSDALKRALNKFFKKVKVMNKQLFIVSGITIDELKDNLERFNTSYNEHFQTIDILPGNQFKISY